jgi:hypothetical protein
MASSGKKSSSSTTSKSSKKTESIQEEAHHPGANQQHEIPQTRGERRRAQFEQKRIERKSAPARQQREQKLLKWGGIALAAVLLLGIGYGVYNWLSTRDENRQPEGVVAYNYTGGEHSEDAVEYTESPPVGGTHNPAWQTCQFYDGKIANENAVHSLEHGAVWITYDPSLPADDVQRLHEIANQGYIIVSPYPGLTDPVVASSWARQIRLTGVDDPRLQQFIVDFRRNPETAPEPNATCSMGVTDVMPTGELPQQPAANAGTQQQAGATETPAVQGDARDEYKEKN